MAKKIILAPKRIDDWLFALIANAKEARSSGFDIEIEAEAEGMLSVDKNGKTMFITRLEADLEPEQLATLLGGEVPVSLDANVGVELERQTHKERLVWGKVRVRITGQKPQILLDALSADDVAALRRDHDQAIADLAERIRQLEAA